MDVLIIPCPSCGHELRLPDPSLLGRFGRCPGCRHKFVLEDPNDRLAETGEFTPTSIGSANKPNAEDAKAVETAPIGSSESVSDSDSRHELPQRIGRYQIKGELGQGSMGAVYLAFDSQLHRDVALKVPKFSAADGTERIERFYREARLAATLSHPSICPVYDIGEADGTRYIAMAYIEGRPLTDYVRRDRPQPVRHIAKTICRVAMAVQEAHDHGVLHRDLKPDNIMIDENRKPVIMDFGLAKRLFREGEERLTHSGALVGSPAYMSPEQVEGDSAKISASSDIYSLGVVMYELLTGLRPFRGFVGAVMGKILHEKPQPPSHLRADIDPGVEEICLRMLEKHPRDRFASMDKVAHALAAWMRGPDSPAGLDAPTIDLPAFLPQSLDELKPKTPRTFGGQQSRAAAGKFGEPPAAPDSHAITIRTARKLIASCDFDNAVELLSQVPEAERDAELMGLLGQARERRGQVKSLIADINRARRNRDYYSMCRKLERLLELKPNHHRARRLLEDLEQKGFSGAITELSIERQCAEWILHAGGTVDVLVEGEPIQVVDKAENLPAAEFRVVACGLSGCGLIDNDQLSNISGLSSIQKLSVAQTKVSDGGLKYVVSFNGVTSLFLGQSGVTGDGLKHLDAMNRLVKLDLSNTALDDAGIRRLKPRPSLEFLGLFGTRVTDASASHLALMTGLTFLDLYDTGFTSAGVNKLSRSLPNCRINY